MPGPGDYLDPNNQMLANWWEPMYGQDYNQFGGQIDSRTNQYGYDYGRYRDAGDQAYGVGGDGSLPANMQYSPEEQDRILREQQRRQALTTPEEYQGMYRTGEEQAGISGDPFAGYNEFQRGMSGLNRDLDFSDQRTFDYLGEQDRNVRGVGDEYGQTADSRLSAGAGGIRGAVTTGRGDYNSAIGQGQQDFNRAIDQGQQGYGSALREGASGIRSAANAQDLQLDAGYGGRIRGVLGEGESAARGIYQNPELLASEGFMNDYQFGDQDMSDLETLAGTAAGARYRDLQGQIERRAAAGGQTSASALATIQGRFQREAAQEAADAVLNARTQGKGMQLDTIRGREDVRLGAQQAQANLGTGAELELGGRRLGAETMTEQMRLDAAQRQRQMQQTGESTIMGARMGAEDSLMGARSNAANATMGARTGAARDLMSATQAGESDIMRTGLETAGNVAGFRAGNEMALGQSRLGAYDRSISNRLGVGQFGTEGAAGYQAGGEATSSARAANAADTRTDTSRYTAGQRSGQEMGLQDRLSQGSQGIADARLRGGQEQRGYMTGMAGMTSQGQLTSQGQRQNQFNTRFGAANTAGATSGGYATQNRQLRNQEQQQPKPWERWVGAGIGLASGLAGGG